MQYVNKRGNLVGGGEWEGVHGHSYYFLLNFSVNLKVICYTAETNTPLQSSYTPIKMFKEKKVI